MTAEVRTDYSQFHNYIASGRTVVDVGSGGGGSVGSFQVAADAEVKLRE